MLQSATWGKAHQTLALSDYCISAFYLSFACFQIIVYKNSAYFLFSVATRPTVKEENPDASFGDIARLISSRFKGLNDKDKKVWEDKAEADKERYQREMEEYRS